MGIELAPDVDIELRDVNVDDLRGKVNMQYALVMDKQVHTANCLDMASLGRQAVAGSECREWG